MADDHYFTIARESKAEIKVKGSRFIGESFLVPDADHAMEMWQVVRKREYNATHHCYAFHVGLAEQAEFKYSDDGEPNGTAGKPIYDLIEGKNLTSTLVVVTRYYGGTKLGTGGLVRAYSDAARQCLENSGRIEQFLTDDLQITMEFSLYDRFMRVMDKFDARAIETDYSDVVKARVQVRQSRTDAFTDDLIELSGGKAIIEKVT